MAQETIFLSTTAFDQLTKEQRAFLAARFSDGLFQDFIEKQEEAARQQLVSLDPDDGVSDETYRHKAREFRAVWRFWQEFKEVTQLWAARSNR